MRKRREKLNADITPFIDVAFLLLVFFLVSSVLKKDEYALNLNLPETESINKTELKREYIIELSTEEISYNGEVVSFKSIDEKLSEINDLSSPIFLRIDEDVKYKRIMKLFDILENLKLKNVMLVSEDK